jgi:hypothetical protein
MNAPTMHAIESQWEEVVDALIGTPLDYLLDQVTAHDGRFWWKGADNGSNI